MSEYEKALHALGDRPPLVAPDASGGKSRHASRRRLLAAVCLAGLAAGLMLGLPLYAVISDGTHLASALGDGNHWKVRHQASFDSVAKARRIGSSKPSVATSDRQRIDVATLVRGDDRDTVRSVPFVHLRMALEAGDAGPGDYPAFDALDIFAEAGAVEDANRAGIARDTGVSTGVSFRTVEFAADTLDYGEHDRLSDSDAEKDARTTDAIDAARQAQFGGGLAINPLRFGGAFPAPFASERPERFRIVPENLTVAARTAVRLRAFSEETLALEKEARVADLLLASGHEADAERIAAALSSNFFSEAPGADRTLRLGIEATDLGYRIVRASLYADGDHIGSVARSDSDAFVAARAPERRGRPPARPRGETTLAADFPGSGLTVYDAINRSALAYGLSPALTRQILRLIAADIDYRAALDPSDRLELFFSEAGEDGEATDASEIYFIRFAIGGAYGTLYRSENQDGEIEYFGPEARSSRAFLMRNPVPNARFSSGYGMRRHPILGYARMHSGVDWAAPNGAPVVAASAGIVEFAGWRGGYGRQTVVRHANGYVSSYSHQSGFAPAIAPGAPVRQGQVIGFVGSTGLTTGSHLHFEVSLNGESVDPMRVRLPESKALRGLELEAFLAERDRIDALIYTAGEGVLRLAANDR